MISHALNTLIAGNSLDDALATDVMTRIMEGEATSAQIAALLMALRMRGETVDEITAFARVMRAKALHVPTHRRPLVDTCGTGGDTCKTFNVSTASAFVAASAPGIAVAKHGNRSVTSRCGSADVLEALGFRLDLTPEQVGQCVDAVGIGFLFARSHHPAMKYAAPVRAELGIRTVFNALGPLTNPAGATRQVVGVYDAALCPLLAQVLINLGAEHVLVVHGEVGLDEIATFGSTVVSEGRAGGHVETYTIAPQTLGLPEAVPADVAPGTDATENAAMLRGVLLGTDLGPRRDIVLANAAAALYVGGACNSLRDGVALASALIDGRNAFSKLEALRDLTVSIAEIGKTEVNV